jgi:CRP-like cAMP-binding protein
MNGLWRYNESASERDWADVLATFPLFAGLRKWELRRLVRGARFMELARGERLAVGAEAQSLYVILGGGAELGQPAPRSLRTGDSFGGTSRALQIVATEQLHVMKLPRRQVMQLARRHPPVTAALLKNLSVSLQPASATRT